MEVFGMKKCIIFDMDGVIIDSEPIHMAIEKEVLKRLGISISDKEHHSMIGTTDKVMWTHLKSKYKLPQQVDELVSLKQDSYEAYIMGNKNLQPIFHITVLINALYRKGFLLTLASSSARNQVSHILKAFGLDTFFHAIVSGDDVKYGKPNPDIFQKTSELVGVSAKYCVVIEDSENGVLAAKKAGMKCIGYRNPNSGKQDLHGADIVVNSFDKLSPDVINDLMPCGGSLPEVNI